MGQGYRHLSLDERVEIEKGIDREESLRSIARRLSRNVSTISRETRRNAWRPSNTSAAYRPVKLFWCRNGSLTDLEYRAGPAQRNADRRMKKCHQRHTLVTDAQVGWVCDKIKIDAWTPEQVAGYAKITYPDDQSMRVCTETLYEWIYGAGKHHGLAEYLTRAHTKRRKHSGRRVHSCGIDMRVGYRDREPEVEDRVEFGHWEGDSVEGPRTAGAGVHTEVERKTRYLQARLVPTVDSVCGIRAQIDIFAALPPQARKTVTLDNGREHHLHWMLVETLGVLTYFADPYSSWQRGTNENINGVLRRWFPKGTRFEDVTEDELQWVVNKINNRPLKCLGWLTPAQAFQHELNQLQSS